MTTYTTRCEAIQHEIIDPIEKAENINACEVFNINAIAYQVLGDHSQGYARRVDTDTFWAIVDSCKWSNPDEGGGKPVDWCIVWRYHEPGVDSAEFDWDGSPLIDGPHTIVVHDTALLTRRRSDGTWEHVDDETIEQTENPDPYVDVEDELLKRHGLTRGDVNII